MITLNDIQLAVQKGGLAIIFILGYSFQVYGQITVIAHPSVPEDYLSIEAVRDIFSLEKANWKNGTAIKIYEIRGDQKEKDRFYASIKYPKNRIKRSRLRVILAGEADPPILVDTYEEIIEIVFKRDGAIAFLPAHIEPGKKVKVISSLP